MNCEQVKYILKMQFGEPASDDSLKEHIRNCPDCREYFEELQRLEKTMKSASFESLSATEFALVQEKLDNNINQYLNRAVGFYRLMVRYGTSLAAVCLLLFISLVSDFNPLQETDSQYDLTYQQLSYNAQDTENDYMDEDYIDDILFDYVQNYGYDASQLLLGELYEEEYEYLDKNLKAGDIL